MSRHQKFWTFSRNTFCKVLAWKTGLSLDPASDPEPKPPFIVVSNHGNFFDPWLLGLYQKTALNIMMNDDGFRSGALSRWYLHMIGAFAKKKGAQDITALKKTLSFLKNKEAVIIFPEGQATWDGETQPIYGGIERMVKRAKCSLIVIKLKGNFLAKPWWAESTRKGRISVLRTVYDKDRIADMDVTEIQKAILDGIYNNDICDKENLAVPFRGKRLALGTERLLWTCAVCGEVDSIFTEGDNINCNKCGASFSLDAHCQLHTKNGAAPSISNLHAWHQHDKRLAKEKIATCDNKDILCRNENVSMLTENDKGIFETVKTGTLSLTATSITFVSLEDKNTLQFPVKKLSNYVVQKKDTFEVTFEKKDYRFEMPGRSPLKWVVFMRYLNDWEEIEKTRVI